MKKETITVSIDWAKKIKLAGWPQSWTGVFNPSTVETIDQALPSDPFGGSYFKWFEEPDGHLVVESIWCTWNMICEAPTSEEILRRLPDVSIDSINEGMEPGHPAFSIKYENPSTFETHTEYEPTLADAAAAMYVYLAENHLL